MIKKYTYVIPITFILIILFSTSMVYAQHPTFTNNNSKTLTVSDEDASQSNTWINTGGSYNDILGGFNVTSQPGATSINMIPSVNAAPNGITSAATFLTPISALLNGSTNPNGSNTTAWFRISSTNPGSANDTFGTRVPASGGTDLGSGNSMVPFCITATGLNPGTTYYYCAISQNSEGTCFGSVLNFTTPDAPLVTTQAATSVTSTSADFNGTANPNGLATNGYFRYSMTNPVTGDDNFGSRAPTSGGSALGAGNSPQGYTQVVTGLSPAVTYYYCAIGNNAGGTSFGSIQNFTTQNAITAINRTSSITSNASTVNFTVTFAAGVTGLTQGYFTIVTTGSVGGTSIANFTGSGTTYTVTVNTGTGDGTIGLNLTNSSGLTPAIGNTLPFVGQTYTIDKTAPTISIGSPSASNVNGGFVNYTVTFSDANLNEISLLASDVIVNTTGTANFPSRYVFGSGNTRTVQIMGVFGTGTIGISIPAGKASDLAGNLAGAAGPSTTFSVDSDPPTIVSVNPQPNGNYITNQSLDFTVNFSEPVTIDASGGTPYLSLTFGSTTVHAPYISGSGTSSIVFRHNIVSGDADGDGIALNANITLNGAIIRDAATNDAILSFSPASYTGILVNVIQPTVTTQAVSGINVTTATGNGNITNLGVQNPSQYGVVWSTSTNPTIDLSTKTTQGTASSTGAFTSNITGLTANTFYHVRAYATNSSGTSYGNEVSFTTSFPAPVITGISPTSGQTAGTTSVAITGSNFTNATTVNFGVTNASFTVNSDNQITATSPAGSAGSVDVTVTTASGTSATSSSDQFTYVTPPSIYSFYYDASTGVLMPFCNDIHIGDNINLNKFTITGEGGAQYTLTSGTYLSHSSSGDSKTLNATDINALNLILNKVGTVSTGGTSYNLAGANGWDASVSLGDISDATNQITVSNVAVPTITSATYNAATGALVITGTGFLKLNGATNDINVSKLTITGEGGTTYTLTTTSVEISSGSSFTIILNATDLAGVNLIINKNGTSSTGATTYNLAAAEDWASGADAAVVVADLTGNGITASNVAAPTITNATYDASTGALVVTGTGFLKLNGTANDIVANKLTIVGEGGGTYTLTDTPNVEITSGTSFSMSLSSTDKEAFTQLLNKNGTSSTSATTYNLAAAEDWAAGADAAVVVADLSGNGVTVSNVAVPAITSATYNASSGSLVVTGTGFLPKSGATNDIVANKFTFTGEGGSTYILTDTPNVEITSITAFTLTLSATDKAAVNQIINKNGTSSTGATTYNMAAAEDWNTGADATVVIADLSGNGITASNVAVPSITSATYNASTGALVVTGTGFLKLNGSTNDIFANKFTITGEGASTITLTNTPNVEITSGTSFTLTLSSNDKDAVNQIVNKNGSTSIGGTSYNLAAAEDWASGADVTVVVADLTGNGITASGLTSPIVTTQVVSAVNVTSATGNGNITNLGVPNPTQYGVVWSTSTGPTTALSTKTTQGAISSTGSFTSSITGLSANTLYYVKAYVTNSSGTVYGTEVQFTTLPASTTISGTTNWSTATQWDNGSPASSSDVTVNGGIVAVDGTYTVKNATVNPNAGLSVGSGQTLNVTGNLILKSDGTNTSSLIINGGTLNVTGTITVERYMIGNKWYIISPTASGGTVADFLTANSNIPTSGSSRGMQEYNTTLNSWNPYYTGGSGNMESGKGYAARIASTGVVNFTGTLTSGTKTVTVTRTGDNGWNCIGNPYTSAIHIDATADATNNFLTLNSGNLDPSYAAIYVWDESGTYDGRQNYYDVVSNAEFTLPRTQLGQDRVQVGQGFFVKVKTVPTNVIFTPEMQIHQNTLPLKSTKVSWPVVELAIKTDSLKAYTDIAYNERMTPGLDPTYDAGLLRGANKLNIYSHLIADNGIDFAIQCLPDNQYENQVIPIGIDYAKGGEVKITAQVTGLPSGMNVILEDRVLKTFTALNTGSEFKVTVDPNTKGIGRFYLHTTSLTVNDLKTVSLGNKLNAYVSADNEIRIIGEVSSKAIATLYDAQGKAILTQNLQESNLNVIPASNIKTGIYMLAVRDTGKLQSFKLFIKQ